MGASNCHPALMHCGVFNVPCRPRGRGSRAGVATTTPRSGGWPFHIRTISRVVACGGGALRRVLEMTFAAEVGVTNVASLSFRRSVSPLATGEQWPWRGSITWRCWACGVPERVFGRGQDRQVIIPLVMATRWTPQIQREPPLDVGDFTRCSLEPFGSVVRQLGNVSRLR